LAKSFVKALVVAFLVGTWAFSYAGASVTADLDELAATRPADWQPLPVVKYTLYSASAVTRMQLAGADPSTRAQAAFLAGEIGDTCNIPALQPLLGDPDRFVRIQAGIALCRLRNEAGLSASTAALVGTPPWVRYYAVVGLWQLGTEIALKVLARFRYGQCPLVAEAMSAAIAHPRDAVSDNRSPIVAQQAEVPAPRQWADVIEAAALSLLAESDWWWHRGEYDQCVRCNDALLFFDPTFEEVYTNSAWLLWSMGRHTEAIGTYHRCIQRVGGSNHGYFYLGFYYYQHEFMNQAEPYLRRAVEMAPEDHLARRAYAHCLERLGRIPDAIAQWEAILRYRPDDGAALTNLRRLEALAQGAQKQ
jgi:tetratricopeptide (TPR) repeat protein